MKSFSGMDTSSAQLYEQKFANQSINWKNTFLTKCLHKYDIFVDLPAILPDNIITLFYSCIQLACMQTLALDRKLYALCS